MMIKKSFAKINLYLEVIGKRADGYHLLDSLMTLIDIFDLITIEKSDKLELVIEGSDNKSLQSLQQNWQENIIIRAVDLLSSNHNFFPKVKITLQKNIPIAAGLGGGSSNAACTMLMLNELYQLGLSQKQLLDLGLQIGADVPFFLNALTNHKPMFVSGIGEVLKNYDTKLPDWHLLIINPNIPLSTHTIFDLFDKNNSRQNNFQNIANTQNQEILTLIKNHNNDLQKYAIRLAPEIALIIDCLKETRGCLLARMSGSGASCFAIFDNAKNLEKCSYKLQKTFPGFYIKQSSLLYQIPS